MKINELIQDFEIYVTNEESALLDRLSTVPLDISSFNPREQVILDNMIRKSVVSKVRRDNTFMVIKNDISTRSN